MLCGKTTVHKAWIDLDYPKLLSGLLVFQFGLQGSTKYEKKCERNQNNLDSKVCKGR